MTTVVTIVAGASGAARERAIAGLIPAGSRSAVLLEGIPDGSDAFAGTGAQHPPEIIRIAAGCPCCTGNLAMRVTLNRLLRKQPQHLFIGVADPSHLASLQAFLSAPPYDALLHIAAVETLPR